ncbi:hypothetical protein N7449_004984 [Penicillium cf. viridicatum]|uniref:DUF4219 domain-containing protein n=1 Tax=Penicillium cf. viridicatum TaxID=2972119 RepID=A0A9W9MKB2_9EURO|nr:hypothetical protein N7449_004984 [Penicillium cf. viridicatum]
MSALVYDSSDRAVTAIEPLTGSDNFATWKRLMTSYLKASLRPYREILDTAGDPVKAEGISMVKLTLRGKFNQPLVLKNVYFALRVGINLISVPKLLRDRYSVVAYLQNVFVQRRGRTVGTAYHAEEDLLILRYHISKRSRERVQLARAPATYNHTDSLEPQAVAIDVDDPQESSGTEYAASTSKLGGKAMILEEAASNAAVPGVHIGKTVFSRNVEFDKRTPVAPLIEGETGNDLPDNAPPSPVFSPVVPPPSSALPTPPASPPDLAERLKTPTRHMETLPPVNPIEQEAESTQDLGYSIYSRRRRPSRRLLESLGKVYTAGALNTTSTRTVDPSTFHEAVSYPNHLE